MDGWMDRSKTRILNAYSLYWVFSVSRPLSNGERNFCSKSSNQLLGSQKIHFSYQAQWKQLNKYIHNKHTCWRRFYIPKTSFKDLKLFSNSNTYFLIIRFLDFKPSSASFFRWNLFSSDENMADFWFHVFLTTHHSWAHLLWPFKSLPKITGIIGRTSSCVSPFKPIRTNTCPNPHSVTSYPKG